MNKACSAFLSWTALFCCSQNFHLELYVVGIRISQQPLILVNWDFAATNTFLFGIPANILANFVFENKN